ncbi:MAG: hypothetical protein A2170_06380 [Deltaproteobacteria bacterium RBG_13_53_10]|nr:MAG: hypothetical protein A2170_06380 [Deltaproteobacteria bacterium RBG_13_53_10]
MCSYEDISKQSFELAFNLACKKLANMTPEEICHNSGASSAVQDKVMIDYLNRPYVVTISTGEISPENEEETVPVKDQILILHYLTQAKGKPFTDKLITYGQIEGGKFYIPAFIQRNIQPLLKCFGHRPELLLEVGRKIGGISAAYGDVAVRIDAFPRVRIFFILWKGDDEVSPNGTILFDGNIPDYLSSEDVCVLTETIVWKLVRMA